MGVRKAKSIRGAFLDVLNHIGKYKGGEMGIIQMDGELDYLVETPDDWGNLDNIVGIGRYRTVLRVRCDELNAMMICGFGLTWRGVRNADAEESLEAGEQLGCEPAGTHDRDVPPERKPDGEGGRVPGSDDNGDADGRKGDCGP